MRRGTDFLAWFRWASCILIYFTSKFSDQPLSTLQLTKWSYAKSLPVLIPSLPFKTYLLRNIHGKQQQYTLDIYFNTSTLPLYAIPMLLEELNGLMSTICINKCDFIRHASQIVIVPLHTNRNLHFNLLKTFIKPIKDKWI